VLIKDWARINELKYKLGYRDQTAFLVI